MSSIAASTIRDGAASSRDARVARTRQAIVDGLTAAERAGEVASVSNIVNRAGISRSVFYRHFSSLDDLAIFLLDEALAAVSREDVLRRGATAIAGAEVVRADVRELVRYLDEHRTLFRAVLSSESGPRAAREMQRAYISRVNAHLPHFVSGVTEAEVETDLVFFAGGLVAVLTDWLCAEDARPADTDLVELVIRQMPAWMVLTSPDVLGHAAPASGSD